MKNIIFCADGTWNHPDQMQDGLPADTNVYKFFKALPMTAEQLPLYDDGVGAQGTPIDRLLGGAIGDGLFAKIKDGYTQIAHSYQEGDQIFLFGFSRGAYTARALAGMIAVCGLPDSTKFSGQATEAAFQAYRTPTNRQVLLAALAADYGNRDVEIAVVGVWDTVGALGIPGCVFEGLDEQIYGFLSLTLHPNVHAAYHAVSIDERRAEFAATLWMPPLAPGQELDQVWFAGVHGDVGGGYGETGLSDITLGWMMQKARAKGVSFDPDVWAHYSTLDPKHALDQIHESWNVLWGFPESRSIPAGATVDPSVQVRLTNCAGYTPANLLGSR
jgi:uncharacterized protein (DUF2235 family)